MSNENEINQVTEVETTSAPSASERNGGSLSKNVVVVTSDDDVKIVKEEVSQSSIKAKVAHTMPKNDKIDYTAELKGMVGSQLESVQDYLDTLQKNKVIVSYKIVPIGMATTLELEPGRVTVSVDATKRIIDMEIS